MALLGRRAVPSCLNTGVGALRAVFLAVWTLGYYQPRGLVCVAGLLAFIAWGGCGAGTGAPTNVVDAPTSPSFHLDNEACGSCHVAIYEAWEASRHAQAWKSEAFRVASENYTLTECLSCHAPDLVLRAGLGAQAGACSEGP